MAVYILRHGIAIPHTTPGMRDFDRPLTPQGLKRVRQIARGFASLALNVDEIVTSPLPRALQTAEIMHAIVKPKRPLEISPQLSVSQSAAEIAAWLQNLDRCDRMLIGHNPSLSDLIGLLLKCDHPGTAFALRRGGMAALQPLRNGDYTLDWFARPRLLRRRA